MKAVISRKNKQNFINPQTKTLETNTIRSKSWPYALSRKRHTPVIALVVAGFLIGIVSVVHANTNNQSEKTSTHTPVNQQPSSVNENVDTSQTAPDSKTEDMHSQNQSDHPTPALQSEHSTEQSNSLNIHAEINTNQNSSSNTQGTSITVNGENLQPDKNGRINEEFENEESKVRIRAKVSPNSPSNGSNTRVDISTNSTGGSP